MVKSKIDYSMHAASRFVKESVFFIFSFLKQAGLYLFFGILTTVINISVYLVCTKYFLMGVLFSTIVAWLLAVLFAFFTNKYWVFQTCRKQAKVIWLECFMFYISRIGTGFMDLGLMYFSVNVMNFNDVYSKVFSNFIVVIANYIISRYYIFSEKERV